MALPDLLKARLKQVNVKVVTGANPAANAEASDAVPAGKVWELMAYRIVMVQGATQTPLPILQLDDGTTIFAESPGSTTAQAVSTTAQYTWAPGLLTTGQLGTTPDIRSTGGLPEGIPLLPGYRVRTVTPGKGANSDYGAPQMLVAEYDL